MSRLLAVAAFVLLVACRFVPAAAQQTAQKQESGSEEFFILSAVNSAKSQILLKRPTEVTVLMKVSERTKFLDEKGKALKLSDLRAGDTVWVVSAESPGAERSALRIRKGPMTVQDLHRIYLRSSS